jgi:hypothetical protein
MSASGDMVIPPLCEGRFECCGQGLMIDTNYRENPDHLARLLIRPGGGIKDSDRPKLWWMGVELSLSLSEAVVFPSDLCS